MDHKEFFHRMEMLHDAQDCDNCPAALEKLCIELFGEDSSDLCSQVVYAKLALEDSDALKQGGGGALVDS